MRNRANKSGNLDDWIAFKERNARVKRVLADTARDSWEAFCSNLTDQSKLGPVWGMARRMNGNTTQRAIPTLDNGHRQAITNEEKANFLAETYASTSSTQNYSCKFKKYMNRPQAPEATPSAPDEDTNALNS